MDYFPLVIILVLCAVSAHNCIHDTDAHREMRRAILAENKPVEVSYSKFEESAMGPLRVAVDYSHINNISMVCTSVGQSRPNFAGQLVTCGANDAGQHGHARGGQDVAKRSEG